MEDNGAKKKARRRKSKAKTDLDVELADKTVEEVKNEDNEEESSSWVETENKGLDKSVTVENKGRSKARHNVKPKIQETRMSEVDEIQVEKQEEIEIPSSHEEMKKSSEDGNVGVKKSGFKFKLKSLNPLKGKKKEKLTEEKIIDDTKQDIIENKEGQTGDKEGDIAEGTNPIEELPDTGAKKKKNKKVKQKEKQTSDNEKEEEDVKELSKKERKRKMATASLSLEKEDEMDEIEKSEAENIIHELPSASSTDKTDEPKDVGKKLSAKEKLKQKLDKKKSSDKEPAKLLRHLSSQSSRVEDRLKEEDMDAQFAFEKHNNIMKDKRGKVEDEITAQDAFDFFTATWDDIPTDSVDQEKTVEKRTSKETSVSSPSSKKSANEDDDKEEDDEEGYETANEETEDDKKKLLAREYIGAQYEWEVTEWTGPEIVPYTTRIENEREVYYTPSAFPPTLEDITGNSGSKYTPEQEGVYTGKKPFVQPTNINKMGNR